MDKQANNRTNGRISQAKWIITISIMGGISIQSSWNIS